MGEVTFTGYDSVFATRLRELMSKNGTTQKDLAGVTGITRQAISQYMDGSVQPNIEKLYKICEFFEVSADYLLGKTDTQSTEIDKIAINNKYGLWDSTLEVIELIKDDENNLGIYFFNHLITAYGFTEFVALIRSYMVDIAINQVIRESFVYTYAKLLDLDVSEEALEQKGKHAFSKEHQINFEEILAKIKKEKGIDIDPKFDLFKITDQITTIIKLTDRFPGIEELPEVKEALRIFEDSTEKDEKIAFAHTCVKFTKAAAYSLKSLAALTQAINSGVDDVLFSNEWKALHKKFEENIDKNAIQDLNDALQNLKDEI